MGEVIVYNVEKCIVCKNVDEKSQQKIYEKSHSMVFFCHKNVHHAKGHSIQQAIKKSRIARHKKSHCLVKHSMTPGIRFPFPTTILQKTILCFMKPMNKRVKHRLWLIVQTTVSHSIRSFCDEPCFHCFIVVTNLVTL